jgi:co-chaperonin GroES (HSP10)
MLKALRNNVGIMPLRDPDRSKGGIWIPDSAQERIVQGIIKMIGPNVEDETLQIGQHVIFSAYDGTIIFDEEEGEVIMMPETAIKSILHVDDPFVPGVYLQTPEGEYFETTYSVLLEFARIAMREAGTLHKIDMRGRNKSEFDRRMMRMSE